MPSPLPAMGPEEAGEPPGPAMGPEEADEIPPEVLLQMILELIMNGGVPPGDTPPPPAPPPMATSQPGR